MVSAVLFGAVLLLSGAFGAAGAATPDPRPDTDALFSLQRARRVQERDGTPAAPYRPDLSWPVGAEDAERKRWAIGTAGVEYDTHPVLLSNGIGTLDEFTSDGQVAGAWFLDVGAELFERGEFAGGLAGSYWGTDWADWDKATNYPTVVSWLDWNFGELWSLRLRYDLGYASVDLDGFATTHHVGPRFYRDWDENGVTELRGEYFSYDFHTLGDAYPQTVTGTPGGPCALPGGPIATPCGPNHNKAEPERRDRSGWGFILGGEHRMRIDVNETEIRGGYTYEHFIPEGAEFHNQVHEVWVGATTPLPLGFYLDSNLTFLYQATRNPSSFPDPDTLAPNQVYALPGKRRHDHVWRLYTALGRPITPHVDASIEYGFTDHASNLESFDYARHRIGAYVTVHFE
jgi:hypothetical protein